MKYIKAFTEGFMQGAQDVLAIADKLWNDYIAYIDNKFPGKK